MPKAKIIKFELPKAQLLKFNSRGKAVPFTPPVLDEVDQQFGWLRDRVGASSWDVIKPFAEGVLRNRAECNGGTAS